MYLFYCYSFYLLDWLHQWFPDFLFPEHLIFAVLSVDHNKNWSIRSITNLGTILINKMRCNIILCTRLTEIFCRYKILQEKCKIKKTISTYFMILLSGKTYHYSISVVEHLGPGRKKPKFCGRTEWERLDEKCPRCREIKQIHDRTLQLGMFTWWVAKSNVNRRFFCEIQL